MRQRHRNIGVDLFYQIFMRFEKGDRVRVEKSMLSDYIGIEGVIVSVRREQNSVFTGYTLTTEDGLKLEFLEYQLVPA